MMERADDIKAELDEYIDIMQRREQWSRVVVLPEKTLRRFLNAFHYRQRDKTETPAYYRGCKLVANGKSE